MSFSHLSGDNHCMKNWDLIIVGAGFAGVSAAGLYKKTHPEASVLVLEAHSLPGGQASYFRRGGHYFDVGATTLSGFKEGGVMRSLHEALGFTWPMEKSIEGIKIVTSRGEFNWPLDSNSSIFTPLQKQKIQELLKFAPDLWTYSFSSRGLLFPKLSDFLLLARLPAKFIKTLTSAADFLKLSPESLERRIIDELLLISLQAPAEDVPALMASLALDYPSDLWRPEEGVGRYIFGLARHIQEMGVEFRYRTQVAAISETSDGMQITDKNGETYRASEIAMTLPIWSAEKLFQKDSREGKRLQGYHSKYQDNLWSAFTFYGKFSSHRELATYWQVHFETHHPLVHSRSIFFTLTRVGDEAYTFTASVHVRADAFAKVQNEDYQALKANLENWFMSVLTEQTSFGIREDSLELLELGTPRTFERYTRHHRGIVGGIPHTFQNYLKGPPVKPFEKTRPVYYLGDSYFPGQGIAAVATRNIKWARYLGLNI